MSINAIERRLQTPVVQIPSKAPSEVKVFAQQMLTAHTQLLDAHNKQGDLINQALRGGLSASNNSKIVFAPVAFAMPQEAPWLPMTLLNSWANVSGYDVASYLMEPGGRVSTRGNIKSGASTTEAWGNPGYAPAVKLAFSAALTGSVPVALVVNSSGQLVPVFASGTPQVSLQASWFASSVNAPVADPHPFVGAPWPLIVKHGLQKATGCEPIACALAASQQGAPLPQLDWQDIGGGQLRLNGAWGLQWGTRYKVMLRISAEA